MSTERVLSHRVLGLPAHPASAGLARRLVAEVVGDDGSGLVEDAQLLVSEVVTNAVVHARSEVGVTVSLVPGGVRVEVADHSPHLPSPRSYDSASTTTGRGLELVAMLATDFGVIAHEDGKVVWFTLDRGGAPSGTAAPERSAGSARTSRFSGSRYAQAVVDVSLLGVPVALYCAWHQHASALLRESLLLHLNQADVTQMSVAADEIAAGNEALAVLSDGTRELFVTRGTASAPCDVTLAVPLPLLSRFGVLQDTLAQTVRLAARGVLLSPTSQPEVVAMRNWCCTEVLRQGAGLKPTRWVPGVTPATDVKPAPDWDTGHVLGSSQALLAADDTNQIIAVSKSAAALLGWRVDDLVGRRIVTIVPPRLREAHVAGFTDHLVTGRRRIIGTPTTVAALCRDGTELKVRLTIETAGSTGGRTVFIATLDRPG